MKTKHAVRYCCAVALAGTLAVPAVAMAADAGVKWKQEGDKWFLLNVKGDKLMGLHSTPAGYHYFFDKATGEMKTGFQTVDGKKYHFSKDGWAVAGWVKEGTDWYLVKDTGELTVGLAKSAGGYAYYFDQDGKMLTGKQLVKGAPYLFTKDGWAEAEGWKKLDDGWVLVGKDGKLATGLAQSAGGYTYFFDAQGKMLTGKQLVKNHPYLFTEGGWAEAEGWKQVGQDWYLVGPEGRLATGLATTATGYTYCFDDQGKMLTGKQKVGKEVYLFTEGGWAEAEGWKQVGQDWYLVGPAGKLATGLAKSAGGYAYYFDADGKMQTGLQTVGDKKYFFSEKGWAVAGEVEVDGVKYKVDKDGLATPVTPAAPAAGEAAGGEAPAAGEAAGGEAPAAGEAAGGAGAAGGEAPAAGEAAGGDAAAPAGPEASEGAGAAGGEAPAAGEAAGGDAAAPAPVPGVGGDGAGTN